MPFIIACPSCQQSLSLKDEWSGKRVKCPSCSEMLTVPVRAVPLTVAPVTVLAESTPSTETKDEFSGNDGPKKVVKKKKKVHRAKEESNKVFLSLVIGGSVLMLAALVTLIVAFVPFGKMFSSKDVEVVDVFTAVNGMRLPTLGEGMANLQAFTIPGRMKIMVTRPNPQGQNLLVRVKLPYKDLEDFFTGAKGRYFLDGRMLQLEADGKKYDSMIVQTENDHEKGYFELDYVPKGENPRPLTDYLGPKGQRGDWTHEGENQSSGEGFVFTGKSGMKVTVSGGHGGKGHADMRVTWNEGSDGWVVDDSIEQPNELGLNWELILIFAKPQTQSKEVTLKLLNKTRKLKLP